MAVLRDSSPGGLEQEDQLWTSLSTHSAKGWSCEVPLIDHLVFEIFAPASPAAGLTAAVTEHASEEHGPPALELAAPVLGPTALVPSAAAEPPAPDDLSPGRPVDGSGGPADLYDFKPETQALAGDPGGPA